MESQDRMKSCRIKVELLGNAGADAWVLPQPRTLDILTSTAGTLARALYKSIFRNYLPGQTNIPAFSTCGI